MRKKIKTNKKEQRLFIMLYFDCLESDLLADPYQVTLYMALKKFAGSSNQCFPSLQTLADEAKMSKRKAQKTLKELEKKHIISIKNRVNANGGKSSNLYILYDFEELWQANSDEEAAAAIEKYEEKKMVEILRAKGYKVDKEEEVAVMEETATAIEEPIVPDEVTITEETVVEEETTVMAETVAEKPATATEETIVLENRVENVEIKEKGLVSGSDQTTDTSTNITNVNSFCDKNYTTQNTESQPLERYTMEEIRKRYDYYIYMLYNPTKRTDIDIVFDILYDTLNTTKKTVRINGEDKPTMVVIGKLLKLDMEDILYVIEKYREQTGRIKNVKSYLLTMLYNAKEQYHLDIQNQVSHDMDQWHEQKAQERMNELE